MEKKIIHLYDNCYRYGEDVELNSVCGLGDYLDRHFEFGTTDIKKVTCENCLKSKKTVGSNVRNPV